MTSSATTPIAERPEPERIYLFVQHLGRRLRDIDARAGLTPARFSTLASLRFHGSRNIGDLAADERVKAPSMTRLVRDMARDGLLTRAADPADGRGVVIALTPNAATLFDAVRAEKIALVADYLGHLDLATQAAIKVAFAALDDLAEPPEPGS
ncbi:MAG TPA: MarR family winged helix-turn-helix transcriptional regulator [Caulobacteraceae bacterium]|nr:MarR family winged helix-turn-helix transcriptional regulator [Caulobacteraceae bacterium]